MTLHELHPEELLDKAERGVLDQAEQAKLDRHLESCAVCRFETRARADFRSNEEEFSDDAIDQIVGASLRGADARAARLLKDGFRESRGPQRRAVGAGAIARGNRRWAVLLAAAVLLVSAQATARFLGIHASTWLAPPEMSAVTTNGTEASDSPSSKSSKASSRSKEQPAALLPIPEATPAPTQGPTPVASTDLAPAVAPTLAATVTTTTGANRDLTPHDGSHGSGEVPLKPSNAGSVASPSAFNAPNAQNATASALFTQANADRTQGRHMVATREYRELLENYPNAPEADLSRATLGRLMLDDGDAMGALPLFNEYLRIGGPLREETMVNRATALGRLHRVGEESAAWKALLDAYPQSMHAERARERLEELDAR